MQLNTIYEECLSSFEKFYMTYLLEITISIGVASTLFIHLVDNTKTIKVINVFGILIIAVLVLYYFLWQTCQSIRLDFDTKSVSFKMYKRKQHLSVSFNDIESILISNWLVFQINGKKIRYPTRISPKLIAHLNAIKPVSWTNYGKLTTDPQLKKEINRVIENQEKRV